MILAIIVLIIVILIVLGMRPFKLDAEIDSNPANGYEEAAARINQLQAAEAELAELNPECATKLLTHGEKVDSVILFLHGFTSCSAQFAQLGAEYFEKG